MPDDAAEEKAATIRALGATVQRVRPVSITHPEHFVNVARRAAEVRRAAFTPARCEFWSVHSFARAHCVCMFALSAGGDRGGRARRGLFRGPI
jgi:cysteine synthase